ncbi:hypothetical protein AGABI2DRAFT_208718 [Agaricus bisporus var. bisporus H97]|uniref:hypothetical protein n=1 Tax=Agaricus bisporus var. bisporus (strain H97 / ATCC MYA-4626 / FGSC 10389) TaxID=936046 RepID=UPI00029F59EC|nr:hypothetical protein AGABI2DRAFT_208718 [Agaricus bisporus var. bisporus H97]EKV44476.1 hypothetical protein AGABI2DRAFT_208718 [Agaricus bisporus var. bisporus H97]
MFPSQYHLTSPLLLFFLVSSTQSLKLSHPSSKFPFTHDPGFDIAKVAALGKSLPSHSWEYGTAAEALLELYDPEISVFSPSFLSKTSQYLRTHRGRIRSLEYAADVITLGTDQNALSHGGGAIADPASLGVSAILLGDYLKDGEKFADGATEQMGFTVGEAPRWENGAISHRLEAPELWADFVYMAPPFLAYYGLYNENLTLLEESVEQCRLYRQVLQASGGGLWRHIVGPSSPDPGLWSTGNAWAAAGMARILAAVTNTPKSVFGKDTEKKYTRWRSDAIESLTGYITEILDGAIAAPKDDGLLRNYLDDTSGGGHGFGEISGSTLLASVVYRMAVLQPKVFAKKGSEYLDWADGIMKTMGKGGHITENGTATPAVNPLAWQDTKPFTTGSPEGQNFVVLMYVTWRDCVDAGIC